MTLVQLEYFMTLAETLSFSKTAERLYVSQPNVSMQISALEKEWGFPLVERGYRKVSLTPGGANMYRSLKNLGKDFEDSLMKSKTLQQQQTITVCIGVPELTYWKNLSDILIDFERTHPGFSLRLASSLASEVVPNSLNSPYDLVINQRFMLHQKKDLIIKPFRTRRFCLFVSANHPKIAGKKDIKISDLSGEKIFLPRIGDAADKLIDNFKFTYRSLGFTPGEIIITQNVETALMSANMGLGLASLDDMVLLGGDHNMICLPSETPTEFVLAWRKDNNLACLEELAETIDTRSTIASTI